MNVCFYFFYLARHISHISMIHLKEFNLKKKLDINLYPKKEQTTLTTTSISLKACLAV